jgi:hypothetical protein
MSGNEISAVASGGVFTRETLVKGEPTTIQCVELASQVFELSSGAVRVARLEDEWYEDVRDPEKVVEALRQRRDLGVDLFTFWQRVPEVEPKYAFHLEWEEIAALKVTSYENWFNQQIKSRIRTTIRKAEKEGLVIKETAYDDDFVRGMTAIFNEAPVRQGRKFWHYGKDFATVKSQFSRYVHRESMISARIGEEMVGLVMLGDAGRFALLGQILSSLHHRDKSPNNALIAKAVEICAKRGFEYLVYWYWGDDSLAEFKRRCGFERMVLPRYYIPLTTKGRIALKTGVHHGLAALIPPAVKRRLKSWRATWHAARSSS